MADYCSLHIRSNACAELPKGLLKNPQRLEVTFDDNESPERLASFERLRQKGLVKRIGTPRYHWTFSSDGHVNGFDVYEHLVWVLDQIDTGIRLSQLRDAGFECSLQFFWESNGTGGGPLVTLQVAELLVRHSVDLQFGFYWKEADA